MDTPQPSGFEPLTAPNRRRLEHLVVGQIWYLKNRAKCTPKNCDRNGEMMIKRWIFEDLIFGLVLPWTTKNMGWMGFKITMMPSFRTRNLFDSFVLLGEGRDMVEVSQLMFDDLWMAMLGPWVHACIHHSHLSTTHCVIRLHFLHQSFGRSIASVRDISGESEACGSGMFPLLRFWCWMIFAYFCGC